MTDDSRKWTFCFPRQSFAKMFQQIVSFRIKILLCKQGHQEMLRGKLITSAIDCHSKTFNFGSPVLFQDCLVYYYTLGLPHNLICNLPPKLSGHFSKILLFCRFPNGSRNIFAAMNNSPLRHSILDLMGRSVAPKKGFDRLGAGMMTDLDFNRGCVFHYFC